MNLMPAIHFKRVAVCVCVYHCVASSLLRKDPGKFWGTEETRCFSVEQQFRVVFAPDSIQFYLDGIK